MKRYTITIEVEEQGGPADYTLQEALQDGPEPQEGDALFGMRHFFEDVGIKMLTFKVVEQ